MGKCRGGQAWAALSRTPPGGAAAWLTGHQDGSGCWSLSSKCISAVCNQPYLTKCPGFPLAGQQPANVTRHADL